MEYYECAFSLSYPACNAHTPHSHLWPALALQHFSTLSHEQDGFRGVGGWGWGALNIKRVFWFSLQLLSEAFLILRTVRDIIINDICLHVKYPLFLSDIKKAWIFLTDFSKNTQLYFTKIRPAGAELFPCGQTDRQTDTTKVTVTFRNFANAPEDW